MEIAPIAEPQFIFYKGNASARVMELAPIAEPQLIFYKGKQKWRFMHSHISVFIACLLEKGYEPVRKRLIPYL